MAAHVQTLYSKAAAWAEQRMPLVQ